MYKRLLSLLAVAFLAALPSEAEDINLAETPDTVAAVSLSPFSFGLGAGTVAPLNDELSDRSEMFLKLSVINSIAFGTHWNLGMDLNWYLPGQNWGGDLNVDYLIGSHRNFRPFLGFGAGFHYFDKRGSDFGQDLGPSGTAHAGLLVDVLDELQLRIRVPFLLVGNEAGDQVMGLDVGFLFSSPHRKTKVKKLIY